MQNLAQSETSPDLKLFGKNALIYAGGIATLRLASFVLTPLYVYSLTMSDYGLLAVLSQTFQIMAGFISALKVLCWRKLSPMAVVPLLLDSVSSAGRA